MAAQDYIPSALGNLRLWLVNYRAKLLVLQATLNISDADRNAQLAFVDALIASMDANAAAQQSAQSARSNLSSQKLTSTQGIRKMAQKIKLKDEYNNDIGETLGIVGDENAIDIENSKPILKTRRVETGREISFNLQGFFDAVKIFRKRPNEEKKFLAVDTSTPYIDTDPMVVGTQYTAYNMLSDDTVGLESDPATIEM